MLGIVFHSSASNQGALWLSCYSQATGMWRLRCGASPIAPLWSISVEEQFYLLWPWVAKIGRLALMRIVSLLLLPISWFTLVALSPPDLKPRVRSGNSLVQFQFFSVGALLSIGLHEQLPKLKTVSRLGLLFDRPAFVVHCGRGVSN